eukprot:10430420-Heterocapsa_arctica.AAC.1
MLIDAYNDSRDTGVGFDIDDLCVEVKALQPPDRRTSPSDAEVLPDADVGRDLNITYSLLNVPLEAFHNSCDAGVGFDIDNLCVEALRLPHGQASPSDFSVARKEP